MLVELCTSHSCLQDKAVRRTNACTTFWNDFVIINKRRLETLESHLGSHVQDGSEAAPATCLPTYTAWEDLAIETRKGWEFAVNQPPQGMPMRMQLDVLPTLNDC